MNSEIPIGMHQGKVILRLAKHYSDLLAVVLEVVQNAVDSDALRIDVVINQPHRTFTVYDNGTGASQEKITEALQSVGDTLKEKNRYGQFGLGLISPIAIAREFTLTTCPNPRRRGYTAYRFVTSDIVTQSQVSIPASPDENLVHELLGKTWWRTRIETRGITKDRRISRIQSEELAREIALKFGEEIRRRKIAVTIDLTNQDGERTTSQVEAPEYSGEKLERYEADIKECGKAVVELYVARLSRKGRLGEVVFGTLQNPSRITAKQFVESAGTLLDTNTAKALLSGIFEGRILGEKVALHADRTRFENNDALFAFCEILDTWYKKVGKGLVEDALEQASDNRFQRVGTEVMPYAELLLKQVQFETVAKRINIGSIGPGHKRPPKKIIIGPDDGTAIAVDGTAFTTKDDGKGGGGGGGETSPKTDHPLHTPGIVYGVKGRKRTEVKGNSTGLRFAHVEMEDFRVPFAYEPETGTISFNIRNPNWGLCQETDGNLREYHIAVVTAALSLELFRETKGDLPTEVEKFAWENLSHQVFAIRNGKALMKH